MVIGALVAVTTVTMATVVKDAATVIKMKRVITSRERASAAVHLAGLDATVIQVGRFAQRTKTDRLAVLFFFHFLKFNVLNFLGWG